MCNSIFDEEMDTWRVIDDCGSNTCASSTSFELTPHHNKAAEYAREIREGKRK